MSLLTRNETQALQVLREDPKLAADLAQRAAEKDDLRRAQAAEKLAEVLAARPGELAAPEAVLALAQKKFDDVEAKFRLAAAELNKVREVISSAVYLSDLAEGRLRVELRLLAPESLRLAQSVFWRLEQAAQGAIRSDARQVTDASGRPAWRHVTNLDVMTPVITWLRGQRQVFDALICSGQTAAEIGLRCDALIEEARERLLGHVDVALVVREARDGGRWLH